MPKDGKEMRSFWIEAPGSGANGVSLELGLRFLGGFYPFWPFYLQGVGGFRGAGRQPPPRLPHACSTLF